MTDCILPPAFDPKPFIRTFEAAVDKLIAVRKDVQAKTEQMEKLVRTTEREYSKKMADLNRGFEVWILHFSRCVNSNRMHQAVGQTFSGMESKMNEVGRTAIRIGGSPFTSTVSLFICGYRRTARICTSATSKSSGSL